MNLKNLSTYIGLDFGSDSIKAIAMSRGREEFVLNAYAIQPCNGLDLSDTEQVARLAKATLSKLGKSHSVVFVTISSKSPVIRLQMLNNASPSDLRFSINNNSSSYLNQDYSDYYLDVSAIPEKVGAPPPAEPAKQKRFLIAGAPKQEVNGVYEGLRKARLKPVMVQVAGVSVHNAYEFAKPEDFMKAACLFVEIGDMLSVITITNKGVPELVRVLNFGGRTITESIAKSMNVDFAAAQQLKLQPNEATQAAISESISDLIREIRASINYFEGQTGESIRKIDVSGGSVRSEYIRNAIAEAAEVPVEPWNPVGSLKLKLNAKQSGSLASDFYALTGAVGAACEGIYTI